MTSAATIVERASVAWALAGVGGWKKAEVTLAMASVVNSLRTVVYTAGSASMSLGCAMLIQNNASLNWYVGNTNAGASGIISADVASCASYDTMGFNVDAVAVTHAWALVPQDEPILGHLLDIGTATVSRRMNLDSDGTLVYRSPFKAAYSDPTPILTVTTAVDMMSSIEEVSGNKLIVHGVDIVKTARVVKIWDAEGAGFSGDSSHKVAVTVVAGAVFPENVKSAVFWMEWLR
jgi:hypothetical protein